MKAIKGENQYLGIPVKGENSKGETNKTSKEENQKRGKPVKVKAINKKTNRGEIQKTG